MIQFVSLFHQETEELESQNDNIKRDIEVLESQRQKLEQILANHLPTCTTTGNPDASVVATGSSISNELAVGLSTLESNPDDKR